MKYKVGDKVFRIKRPYDTNGNIPAGTIGKIIHIYTGKYVKVQWEAKYTHTRKDEYRINKYSQPVIRKTMMPATSLHLLFYQRIE